ncbi:MAG: oxygen-insensitive NADPH nitroreductase, partial [Marinobacter sp.]|nr:oxygen-insensitive NADPH nitroreductase [Marinobacter sp.]
ARDEELVAGFDRTMNQYYRERTGGNKDTTWSEQLKPLFTSKLRPHMRDFLRKYGFEMK